MIKMGDFQDEYRIILILTICDSVNCIVDILHPKDDVIIKNLINLMKVISQIKNQKLKYSIILNST